MKMCSLLDMWYGNLCAEIYFGTKDRYLNLTNLEPDSFLANLCDFV